MPAWVPVLFSTATLLCFLVGMWFAVRGMIRLDRRLRSRLSARYGVGIEPGAQGSWTLSGAGLESYEGSKLLLHLIVFVTQFGLWMGFVLGICGVLTAFVLVGAVLGRG